MSHDHSHGSGPTTPRRALVVVLGVNAVFLVVEVIGGLAFGSLALLADAAHQASDVVALGIALGALALVTRPGSARHTYGLRRAEALGAQINAVLLLAAAVVVLIEAVPRFDHPGSVDGLGVVALAGVGLVINGFSAVLLSRTGSHDLNLRAAMSHLLADAGGSASAVIAGAAVLAFSATWADPAASVVIAVLVVVSAWRLLRDTANVFLEAAPRGLEVAEVTTALADEPGVEAVHHVHVWELGTDLPVLSAHVVLEGEPTLHDAQTRADGLRVMLADRFGIEHATIELECHDCESPSDLASGDPDW